MLQSTLNLREEMLIILFPYPVHYYPWCASHCEINGDVSPQQGVAPPMHNTCTYSELRQQPLYQVRIQWATTGLIKLLTTLAMKMTWKLTFFPTPTKWPHPPTHLKILGQATLFLKCYVPNSNHTLADKLDCWFVFHGFVLSKIEFSWNTYIYTPIIKCVKLIMFIWKPTLSIFRVTKTYRSASRWT